MGDSDRAATFGYVARELGKREHRVHLRARTCGALTGSARRCKAAFGGVYIANEKLHRWNSRKPTCATATPTRWRSG